VPRTLSLLALVALAPSCGGSGAARQSTSAPSSAPAASAGFVEQDVVDEGLVLPAERYGAGDLFTIVEDFSIKSVIELNAVDTVRYDSNADRESRIEILEVDAHGKVLRERVTFAIDEVRYILNRKAQREASPIAGKTYEIDHGATPITVTDDRGATPPKSEVAAVRAQVESSMEQALFRIFGRHPWRIDQRVELSPDALAAINQSQRDPRTRYTAFAQELRSSENGTASFFITARIEQGTKNGPIVLDLSGMKDVDISTGRTRSMTLGGPVTGNLGGAPGRGEARMRYLVK
jgi:hypothetical protein